MGSIALLGAFLMKRLTALGLALGFLSISFVAGWYTYESFVLKGLPDAEWRQLIMIVVSLITGVWLFWLRHIEN